MIIRNKRGWELPESAATPQSVYRNRRDILKGIGGAMGLAAASGMARFAYAAAPGADLYPFPRNDRYQIERPITLDTLVTTYNNFYEFGSHKKIYKAAQKLDTDDWTVVFDGLVEQSFEIGFEDLLARMPREERLYRHRCVEAWSMTVPWSGFPLSALVDLARPLSAAKYIRFKSFLDKFAAPGQRQSWFPWPFTEGLTLAEAGNELAFIGTGLYGEPLPKQNGAPIRLVVPWKYGFKSIKSIVRITFTDTQPATFWNTLSDRFYGFWANVHPDGELDGMSQATEKPLGQDESIPTRIYNGYGDYVAHLYAGMEDDDIFF